MPRERVVNDGWWRDAREARVNDCAMKDMETGQTNPLPVLIAGHSTHSRHTLHGIYHRTEPRLIPSKPMTNHGISHDWL